jgi:MscS family membrane protein
MRRSVILLTFLLAACGPTAEDGTGERVSQPLRTADTSSPRDTLESFDEEITGAMRLWRDGASYEVYMEPGGRALQTLDLDHLAERDREAREALLVLKLKEILDRIELPPDAEIPGDEDVAEGGLTRWTIPHTRITIARIEEGHRAGEFLFSAETVERLEEDYRRVRRFPYKPGALVGIHDEFLTSPGPLVPRSWGAALPAWSRTVVLGWALWQWFGFVVLTVLTVLLVRRVIRWGRRWDERHRTSRALVRIGTLLGVAAGLLLLYGLGYLFDYALMLIGGGLWSVLTQVFWVLLFVGVAWLTVLVFGLLADVINELRHVREGSIDGQLVRTIVRLANLVVLVVLIVYAAEFFGFPMAPVLGGLGVGGLALALAVRPTLENVIGGLTLFADKPVRIGDYCQYGEDFGTVDTIGLRSTRLRKRDDTLVSVPNSDFSQRELINYTRRRRRLYKVLLGLRYETTPEQLRYVIARLREMLLRHPRVLENQLHVRFEGFGAYSLDVEMFAYFDVTDWLEYRAIREDVNLRVMEIVSEGGTGFAFPSQTTYLGRDSGLDDERGRASEERVREWRSSGKLPFPEFDEGARRRMADTLDYPPEGSPWFRPREGPSDPTAERASDE